MVALRMTLWMTLDSLLQLLRRLRPLFIADTIKLQVHVKWRMRIVKR